MKLSTAFLLALVPASASGQVCALPSVLAAALPDTVPTPGPYATIRDQGPFEDLDLGVGHLRATESTSQFGWQDEVVLPLSETRGASPWGWIARGWIVDGETGRVAPFGVSGLLETGYEEATFLVLEADDDGWLQIRYASEGSGTPAGTAWVPDCALTGEDVELELESWSERLLSDEISPLFFRASGPHVLRDVPSADGLVLNEIDGGDYHLEPLEVAGDWMRVILKQPSDYCTLESLPATNTGWIRWRSEESGPSVWYYTRGC